MPVAAGVDVGKAKRDVSIAEGPVVRFDSTTRGITKLVKHLRVAGRHPGSVRIHRWLRAVVGRPVAENRGGVHVAHPSRVRAFAKACGYEAKTDSRDAQVLSRYGQVFPEPDVPDPDPEREDLRDLLRRRQFVEQRVQERNRLDKGISRTVATSTKRHIAWLDKEIAELDKGYQAALRCSAALNQQAAPCTSVPGPWSGSMANSAASIKVCGSAGSPGNVAVVAVMRKLLLQLNAVARRGTPWMSQAE